MTNRIFHFGIILLIMCIFSCQNEPKTLPVIGDRVDLDGSKVEHDIRPFKFVSQLGDTITNADVDNRIYMTDFFFTSCPSICPKVKKQMLRLYEKVKDNPDKQSQRTLNTHIMSTLTGRIMKQRQQGGDAPRRHEKS